MSAEPLLSIRDLAVRYRTRRGDVDAVRGVSFDVEAGTVTALVGESGSGKSTVAQAAIGLLAANGHVSGGSIRLSERTDGVTDLVGLPERRWRHLRGRCIALIPQDRATPSTPSRRSGGASARRSASTAGPIAPRSARACSICSSAWASTTPRFGRASIRTNSRAACASAC